MSVLCDISPYLFYSALCYWSVSFSLSLSLSVPTSLSKYVYLSFYSIRIASLQGNHGYFSYEVVNINKKQDKMKLENITIVFHCILHYNPFESSFLHYTTSLLDLEYFL